jgi:hypothetical protein
MYSIQTCVKIQGRYFVDVPPRLRQAATEAVSCKKYSLQMLSVYTSEIPKLSQLAPHSLGTYDIYRFIRYSLHRAAGIKVTMDKTKVPRPYSINFHISANIKVTSSLQVLLPHGPLRISKPFHCRGAIEKVMNTEFWYGKLMENYTSKTDWSRRITVKCVLRISCENVR